MYEQALHDRDAAWCQQHPLDDERQWSAQQLVEHLVMTYSNTSDVLEERLAKKRVTRNRSTLLQRVLQIASISLGRFPHGLAAPSHVRPGQLGWPSLNGAELTTAMKDELERMDELLEACRTRFGLQRVASHFIFGPLRVDQWRRFHVIHARHHMKQLAKIQKHVTSSNDSISKSLPEKLHVPL